MTKPQTADPIFGKTPNPRDCIATSRKLPSPPPFAVPGAGSISEWGAQAWRVVRGAAAIAVRQAQAGRA